MPQVFDALFVEARLQEAALTMATLQVAMVRPSGFRSGMPEVVREWDESYGWDGAPCRPGRPSPSEIAAMDQALGWINLISDDKRVLRRIVGARSHTHPQTGRHLFSWRRIAMLVGASHVAVARWHGQGIGMIVDALNRPGLCIASGGGAGPGSAVVGDAVEAALRRVVAGRCRRELELA